MKKYRSSVGQRIYPVEYSSMTGDTVPHIFNTFISLDGGDDYVSRESGNRNEGAYQDNVGSGEGSQKTEKVTNDSGADDTAQKTFPCLVRTYFRKNLMPSEKFAPDKLHDIIDFRKEHKEQQQTPSSGLNPGSSGSDRR